jgi:hypothetical protein
VTLIIRLLSICVGVSLVYTGFSTWRLSESEIKKRQWGLEALWIRIDDISLHSETKQAAFVRTIAAEVSKYLTSIYGTKLVSMRMVGMSFLMTFGTLLLAKAIQVREFQLEYFIFACLLCAPVLAATRLTRITLNIALCAGWTVFALWLAGLFYDAYHGMLPMPNILGHSIGPLILVLGFSGDIGIPVAYRLLAEKLENTRSGGETLLLAAANLVLLVILAAPGLQMALVTPNTLPKINLYLLWETVFQYNLTGVLVCSSMFMLSVFLLIHRLFFPFLSRTVYEVQYRGIKNVGKPFTLVGAILISLGVPSVGAWLAEHLQKFCKIF